MTEVDGPTMLTALGAFLIGVAALLRALPPFLKNPEILLFSVCGV
jgi:hypothetical protein